MDKIIEKNPDVEYIEPELKNCIITAFESKKNNTEEKMINAAEFSLIYFSEKEVYDIDTAKELEKNNLIHNYFQGKDGPALRFLKLIGPTLTASSSTLSASSSTLSSTSSMPSQSSTALKSTQSVTPTTSMQSDTSIDTSELQATSHTYANKEKPPDIKVLFQVPLENRNLWERLSKPTYEGSDSQMKNDLKRASDIVFVDLVKFSKNQPRNQGVDNWVDLRIACEWFQCAANAMARCFQSSSRVVVFPNEKPADKFYDYDRSKKTTQSGILYEKLRAKRKQEVIEKKKRQATPLNTEDIYPPKRGRTSKKQSSQATHSVSNQDIFIDPEDPLRQCGMLTIDQNKNAFFDLYKNELILKNRRLEPGILSKCPALFTYDGVLFKAILDDFVIENRNWDIDLATLFSKITKLSSFKSQSDQINSISSEFLDENDGRLAAMISFLSADIRQKKTTGLDNDIFEIVNDQTSNDLIETCHSQPLIIIRKGRELQQYAISIDQHKIFVKLPLIAVFKMLIKTFFFFNLKYSKNAKNTFQLIQLWLELKHQQTPHKIKNYRDRILRATQTF